MLERAKRVACAVEAGAVLFVGLVALTTSGCGPSEFSLKAIQPAPPSLMVAKKSPRVAFLVIDDAKVPDRVSVLVGGKDRGGKLIDFKEFVRRDLQRAFSNYFADVKVVAANEPLPKEPCVAIDVKVDRVEVVAIQGIGHAVMTWGMGIRPSEAEDYLFSFAGQSAGDVANEPVFVFRSMLEAAITDMLKGYTDKQVHQKILELSVPPAAPAAVPSTPT
jgi:hypothetical protein